MVQQVPAMSPTDADVDAYIAAVPHDVRRTDAEQLRDLMAEITGEPPVMWGASIIGFGAFHYTYESGREVVAPLAAFSPRGPHQVIYLVSGFDERYGPLLDQLGQHKTGTGCLYIKHLSEVDLDILRQLIDRSVRVGRGVDRQTGPVPSHAKRPTD